VRKVLLLLVVLALLAVAADRVGVKVAEAQVARELQHSAGLTSRPTVTIDGVPFLTQAVAGRYDRIQVGATDFQRGGVHVTSLQADLTGLQVPLGDVIRGDVTSIPVDAVTATALVTYADLAHSSGLVGVTITATDGEVQVTGRVTVLGRSVTATAISRVALRGRSIAVTARSLKVLGQTSPALLDALTGRLDLLVPVGTLPYGLTLTGLSVTQQGVLLQARSGPTVLKAG
jgi:hypothetical protein